MAEYTRFDVYLPVHYRETILDPQSGERRLMLRALNQKLVNQFMRAISNKYGGVTLANPLGPAPYQGWWRPDTVSKIVIDHMTYLFVLVRLDQTNEAIEFFTDWSERIGKRTNQEVILVTHYELHTIGDFF
jgi:hypothetical protein